MSKWSTDADELNERINRALIVQEFGDEDVDAVDYLRRTGRGPGGAR